MSVMLLWDAILRLILVAIELLLQAIRMHKIEEEKQDGER
jgi:hypothetical protein